MRASSLENSLAPEVEALGFELYGCEMAVRSGSTVLVVYIDKQPANDSAGVTIDDCSRVSRQISGILDVADPIGGRYQLEVSSPGLNRPLFHPAHYERAVGKKVKFKLRHMQENRRQGLGILKQFVGEEAVFCLEDGEDFVVNYADIEKARLVADI